MSGDDTEHEKGHGQELGNGNCKYTVVKLAGMFSIMVLVGAGVHFAKEEMEDACEATMRVLGLPGLFAIVFVIEAFPLPLPYVAVVYVALKGGTRISVVFTVCCSASYSAAFVGYACGRALRGSSWAAHAFDKLWQKHPQAARMVRDRGAVGVAFGVALPIPLAFVTWPAGSLRIPIRYFALGCLTRFGKILVLVLLSEAAMQSEAFTEASSLRVAEVNGASAVRKALRSRSSSSVSAQSLSARAEKAANGIRSPPDAQGNVTAFSNQSWLF